MKPEFVETSNTREFTEIANELTDRGSLIGPSLAMITGPEGRGKSEAAKHYAVNSEAIYIPPLNIRTPVMVLRDIAFELAQVRPGHSDACLSIIGEKMERHRRLIMIDEAGGLCMAAIEMLRNINERFACPIMLIGENDLKQKVTSRGRLASRIRRRLEFGPISQSDIAFFFKQALGVKVTPDITAPIHRYCKGDWRPVLTAAIGIERAMKASGIAEITAEIVSKQLDTDGEGKK